MQGSSIFFIPIFLLSDIGIIMLTLIQIALLEYFILYSLQPGRNPQVDHARAVKEYSRSSADQVGSISVVSRQQN